MLIIEWVEGIRIDDVANLTKAGHDIGKITEYAARSFFNQVFRDGFFHADMHPGNILCAPTEPLFQLILALWAILIFETAYFGAPA